MLRYLVSVGGALVSHGMNGEGKPWRVAIQKPTDRETPFRRLSTSMVTASAPPAAIATTKNSMANASRTLSIQTGQPITHKLVSVTVMR